MLDMKSKTIELEKKFNHLESNVGALDQQVVEAQDRAKEFAIQSRENDQLLQTLSSKLETLTCTILHLNQTLHTLDKDCKDIAQANENFEVQLVKMEEDCTKHHALFIQNNAQLNLLIQAEGKQIEKHAKLAVKEQQIQTTLDRQNMLETKINQMHQVIQT